MITKYTLSRTCCFDKKKNSLHSLPSDTNQEKHSCQRFVSFQFHHIVMVEKLREWTFSPRKASRTKSLRQTCSSYIQMTRMKLLTQKQFFLGGEGGHLCVTCVMLYNALKEKVLSVLQMNRSILLLKN